MRELSETEREKIKQWATDRPDPAAGLKAAISEMWSIMEYEADCHAKDWPTVNSRISFKQCPCRLCVFVRAGRGE